MQTPNQNKQNKQTKRSNNTNSILNKNSAKFEWVGDNQEDEHC
jgi:hypothetical protein